MSAHTPRPWGKGRSTGGATIFGADDKAIAEVHSCTHAVGNIALIVAAPDLLKALQGLLASVQRGVCDGSGMEQDAARAAIAKAGQS